MDAKSVTAPPTRLLPRLQGVHAATGDSAEDTGDADELVDGLTADGRPGGRLAGGMRRMIVPWDALLTAEEVRRGLTYYGSGKRMQAVASKLLARKAIKVFALGGSVTKGQGASTTQAAFPSRLFEFINSTFPHRCAAAPRSSCMLATRRCMHVLQRSGSMVHIGRLNLPHKSAPLPCLCSGHTFVNKGVGATSSGIFTACVEQMVAPVGAARLPACRHGLRVW